MTNLKEQQAMKEKLDQIESKIKDKEALKISKKGKTKFYLFRQNNSGGSFRTDDKLAINVFIEAHNAEEANLLANDIGIYFDGCDTGNDCSCCGDRWYPVEEDEKHQDKPMIWSDDGTSTGVYLPVKEVFKNGYEDEARVHYLNGTVEKVVFKTFKDCPKHIWDNPYNIGLRCKVCHEWQKYLPKQYGGLGHSK